MLKAAFRFWPAYAFFRRHRNITKTFLVMQLTGILVFCCCLQLAAHPGHSQTVTISGTRLSFDQIFETVERQTGYHFLVNKQLLKTAKTVSVHADREPLIQFLQHVLGDKPLQFYIENKTIVIERKIPEPKTPSLDDYFAPPPISVSGRVLNEKGEPVIASVLVKGTKKGTTTDVEGFFTLENIEDNAILIVSGVTIETQHVSVNHQTSIEIHALTKIGAEEEVVINAGYYSVSSREKTGNISKVSSKEIEKQPVTNVVGALTGRVPGLEITQHSGIPGASYTIRIRGTNSIAAGNDPLYIVDGVPFASQSLSHQYVAQHVPSISGGMSPLNTLNPSDILSIEILKDADATAIYGSRGANGVVLITTKKGKTGTAKYDLNVQYGGSRVGKVIDLMNTSQYIAMRKEAFANDGITEYPADAYDVNGTWDINRYTDWQKELLGGTAKNFNTQAAVSGGSKTTQYLFRLGYQRETTVFPGDFHYGRGSALFNLNHLSEDEKFRFTLSNQFTTDDNNFLSSDITRAAVTLPPNAPALYAPDGSLNWENDTWINPLSEQEGKYLSKTRSMNAGVTIGYKILPQLELRVNAGYSNMKMDEYITAPSTEYPPSWGAGSDQSSAFSNTAGRETWNVEPQVNWVSSLGGGKLDILAGTTFQQLTSNQFVALGYNFPSNAQIFDISSASGYMIMSNTISLYKYQAVFGRINYNWKDKYIVNLTGRKDGSSRFGPGKQFANFGAIGGAWIFSEDKTFRQLLPFLNFGKIRSSYGITGNDQIGDYLFLDTYGPYAGFYQGTRGLTVQRLFNNDFAWENNRKFEAGLELGFLKDRIYLTASYYRNTSSNQLVGIPLPAITGFTSIQSNLGATVRNSGWELELRTTQIQRKNFQWSTSLNASIPKNKLVKFPGLEASTYANQYVVGEPITIQLLYQVTGFDPVTGLYQFEDVNKDGVISAPDDRKVIRNPVPVLLGGIGNELRIGHLQVSFFFQFVKQTRFSWQNFNLQPGRIFNQPVSVLKRYPQDGDQAISQPYTSSYNSSYLAFSRAGSSNLTIEDASFIRLKNVSLSYPLQLTGKGKAQCRLFVLGQNLFTITGYKGGDPESFYTYLPPLKTFTAGVQFTF